MPAYAYAITVNPKHEVISFNETRDIHKEDLTLADLEWVGEDTFSIQDGVDNDNGVREGCFYRVYAHRSRLETDEERDTRVRRERQYVAEYERRQVEKKSRLTT